MTRGILALLIASIACIPALAQRVDTRRLVSVTGEATAVVVPDEATVSVGVETDGLDIPKLKASNDQRVRAILDGVKALGIDGKHVQTSRLTIEPVYNYRDGKQELLRYKMRNVVTIKVLDLSKVESVVNSSVSGGSNLLYGVSFMSSHEDAIRDSLRVEATKNARIRAGAMAVAASAELGKVVTLQEDQGNRMMYARAGGLAKSVEADSSTPVEGGELSIRVAVTAVFEIE